MACHRTDIVQRGQELTVEEIDEGEKNKWSWDWVELAVTKKDSPEIPPEHLGRYIRKLQSAGKAYCCKCRTELKYGQRGVTTLVEHINRNKHRQGLPVGTSTLPGAAPALDEIAYGLNPDRIHVPSCARVSEPHSLLVPVKDRMANQEAMLVAFIAGHNLKFSLAPALVDLVKGLAHDRRALTKLSMDRTTASYKLREGLGKTFHEEIDEKMQEQFFSLNIDEAFSDNLHKVLTILVQYPDPADKMMHVKHFESISMSKVDSEGVYKAVTGALEKRQIPYQNLTSVLLDSCYVMRGCNSGFELRLRNQKANHLLNIDGDGIHHCHNAAKKSADPFENYVEKLFTDIHTDFHWSPDARDYLKIVCRVVGVKYTVPERFLRHRFLSAYSVAVDTTRLWKALTVFYFAFLDTCEKTTYRDVKDQCLVGASEEDLDKINQALLLLQKKTKTPDGKDRKERIVDRLFKQRLKTELVLKFYIAALEQLKRFVVLFQSKEPMIHLLATKQKELVLGYLGSFLKPEVVRRKTVEELKALDFERGDIYLEKRLMFLGTAQDVIESRTKPRDQQVIENFLEKAQKSYAAGAKSLLKKLPLSNEVLLAATALDPNARGQTATLKSMLHLPKLVLNVASKINHEAYSREVRQYQTDASLPDPDNLTMVQWWMVIQGKKTYPNLCMMALALASCFHGPLVEGSFNQMKDLMGCRNFATTVQTYSALQTVKYKLHSVKGNRQLDPAVHLFKKKIPQLDHPNQKLKSNMLAAHKNKTIAPQVSKELPAKRKIHDETMENCKRLRRAHLEKLVRNIKKKTGKARPKY